MATKLQIVLILSGCVVFGACLKGEPEFVITPGDHRITSEGFVVQLDVVPKKKRNKPMQMPTVATLRDSDGNNTYVLLSELVKDFESLTGRTYTYDHWPTDDELQNRTDEPLNLDDLIKGLNR